MRIFKAIILTAIFSLSTLVYAETDLNVPYVEDNVNFLSSEKSFVDLDIDPAEMGRWINELDDVFNDVFKDEIENKVAGVTVLLSAIDKEQSVCKKDYTKCVKMQVDIKFSANVSEKQKKIFSDKVYALKEIKIKNTKSREIAAFMSYMNSRKQEFIR